MDSFKGIEGEMNFFKGISVLAIGLAALGVSAANAATIGFDFNERENIVVTTGSGPSVTSYEDSGYTFSPFNGNNASHCYDNGTGLGCFLETRNGEPTTLTQDGLDAFDGLAFYFDMQAIRTTTI